VLDELDAITGPVVTTLSLGRGNARVCGDWNPASRALAVSLAGERTAILGGCWVQQNAAASLTAENHRQNPA
jgi:hypothetical protein